ncbi:MAG: hypothetical protein ACREEY_09405 [Brevundimonas sp.]
MNQLLVTPMFSSAKTTGVGPIASIWAVLSGRALGTGVVAQAARSDADAIAQMASFMDSPES